MYVCKIKNREIKNDSRTIINRVSAGNRCGCATDRKRINFSPKHLARFEKRAERYEEKITIKSLNALRGRRWRVESAEEKK